MGQSGHSIQMGEKRVISHHMPCTSIRESIKSYSSTSSTPGRWTLSDLRCSASVVWLYSLHGDVHSSGSMFLELTISWSVHHSLDFSLTASYMDSLKALMLWDIAWVCRHSINLSRWTHDSKTFTLSVLTKSPLCTMPRSVTSSNQ